jgi:hypothetical protein
MRVENSDLISGVTYCSLLITSSPLLNSLPCPWGANYLLGEGEEGGGIFSMLPFPVSEMGRGLIIYIDDNAH